MKTIIILSVLSVFFATGVVATGYHPLPQEVCNDPEAINYTPISYGYVANNDLCEYLECEGEYNPNTEQCEPPVTPPTPPTPPPPQPSPSSESTGGSNVSGRNPNCSEWPEAYRSNCATEDITGLQKQLIDLLNKLIELLQQQLNTSGTIYYPKG